MSEVDGRTERARAQREERRAQILEAALHVFASKGYHAASITDLVDAAGVARGTFYLYFESKNDVFVALLDELLSTFRGSVKGVDLSDGAAPVDEQLVATLVRILDAAASSRSLATILFRQAVGLDAEIDGRLSAFEGALHFYVKAALDRGVAAGLLLAHDSDVVATCIYGSIRQIIYRYVVVEGDGGIASERLARALVEHHLRGVLADRGHAPT